MGTTQSSCTAALKALDFVKLGKVHTNYTNAALYELAVARGEGEIAANGPLVVKTGKHTGRSAQDKFIVRHAASEANIWWDNAKEMSPEHFDALHADMAKHAQDQEVFVQNLFGGADETYRMGFLIVNELAWHNLFIRHLLRIPTMAELAEFVPEFTIVNLPSFKADPARHGCRSETVIACDFDRKIILIGGTTYAGETKKSVFSVLNYFLPESNVMPMHCSVNTGLDDTDDSAIFFGLSGTGKTTLSADPKRILIGDDEHGWSENGLFNFEGGCYAKMIRLSATAEPEIYATTQKFGTVLENVAMDPITRELDLDDATLAENSRGAYPINYIPNAELSGKAGQPKNIILLTADAFGVMPPIARLTTGQAMYHFLSGYTAKVAGTEKGLGAEPEATFSTCFGAPFMPRHPSVYGDLLGRLIEEHDVTCWLVNTGWTGGPYGVGQRMPIRVTRALLNGALDGSLGKVAFRKDENFGFDVPLEADQDVLEVLYPRDTWGDGTAYDTQARKLASMFVENFDKFLPYVTEDVKAAAPVLR